MPDNDLESRLTKALACLNFVTGVLAKMSGDLNEAELEGLAFLLSDILDVFDEVKASIAAQGASK